jgi:hypothetical protein
MTNTTKMFYITLAAFFWLSCARADYKFITENPFEAQERLFDDIRAGRLDTAQVAPQVVEATTKESIFAATPAKLNKLGSISQICLFFAIRYPASRALSFRTVHQNGCGDWVITTATSPETVTGIVLVPVGFAPGRTDTCGPPGVIPPAPAGGEHFVLPNNVKCRTAEEISTPPDTDELKKACETLGEIVGGMCKRGNK